MTDQYVPDGEAVGEGVEEPLAPASATSPCPDVAEQVTKAEAVDFEALVAERTEDLQRLQAEYVNYKKRVDRDRALSRQSGIESVVQDLIPVLDSIELAKQHNDIAEGGRMIIAEIEKLTAKYGLTQFGAVGDEFDPVRHEALMQVPLDEPVSVVTVSQVIQLGYELHGRVIRPARVAVANP